MNKTIFRSLLLVFSLLASVSMQAQQPANYVMAPATQNVTELTKALFLQKVWNYEQSPQEWKFLGNKPVIIDFYTVWCGPCKRLAPILESIATEYKDQIVIYKIDAEKERELAAIFQVNSYPRMLFIPTNAKPQVAVGLHPKEEILNMMENILGIKPK